jgi:hypothetical protein
VTCLQFIRQVPSSFCDDLNPASHLVLESFGFEKLLESVALDVTLDQANGLQNVIKEN